MVCINGGRQMPAGLSLLKKRLYLRKDAADQMWKSLQVQGWKKENAIGCDRQTLIGPFLLF